MRRIFVILICSILLACTSQVKEGPKASINRLIVWKSTMPSFAVNYYKDYKELLDFSSDRKDTLHRYYLSTVAKGFVQTPILRLASLSSVYAAYIQELRLEEFLVAVDEKNYINSESILKEIETREIVELGSLDKVNHEALLMAQAGLIILLDSKEILQALKINIQISLLLMPMNTSRSSLWEEQNG